MTPVDEAVAVAWRRSGQEIDLLVFAHPSAGRQIPKGTVEPGGAPVAAARRALHEEPGLRLDAA